MIIINMHFLNEMFQLSCIITIYIIQQTNIYKNIIMFSDILYNDRYYTVYTVHTLFTIKMIHKYAMILLRER